MLFSCPEKQQVTLARSLLFYPISAISGVFVFLGLAGCVEYPATEDTQESTPVSVILEQKGQLHREVWKTIYDYYYDPAFNGVDWVAVGRETNDLLPQAADIEAVYEVLKTMASALNDPHTYVLSPRENLDFEAAESVGVGLTTSRHENMNDVDIVLRVAEGSPAEQAGVLPGWLWLNSLDVRQQSMALGEVVLYRFLDHYEQIQELELKNSLIPKQSNQREVLMLDGNVLYLRFDYFQKGIAQWVDAQLREHPQAEGLVLDLRWNPGGLTSELNLMFQSFLPENSNIGIVVTRKKQLTHEFTAPFYDKPAVEIPMAVLVSPYSASCSEILAAVVKFHGRGTVLGTGTTAGEVLFSPGWKLPGGGLLKIAAKNYLTPAGQRLQGEGVSPHVLTDPRSLFEFRRGIDPTLDAAVAALKGTP